MKFTQPNKKIRNKFMNNTQPILKWAGGKRKLAPLISDIVKYELGNTTNYVEPFFGGGAVFFELYQKQ